MHLIYHPQRDIYLANTIKVHHDRFGEKNEDPYIWNERFLHSYCHITQMKSKVGDMNFWVSGDNLNSFTSLLCDCVFVVDEKSGWNNSNHLSPHDKIVEDQLTFDHHYQWGGKQHYFKKRKRYTLKADPIKSFQPQFADGTLIDVVPYFLGVGISLDELRLGLKAGFQSKPMKLDPEVAQGLYEFLIKSAVIKLFGKELKALRSGLSI